MRNALLGVAIAAIGLGLAAPTARAELPPGSYDKLRTEAQEAVIIQVESVTTKTLNGGWTEVMLRAKVLSVERSKGHLKKGATLTIRYESRDPAKVNFPGPRPIPVLKQGDVYPAFLNANVGAHEYQPAAYGESFVMTPES